MAKKTFMSEGKRFGFTKPSFKVKATKIKKKRKLTKKISKVRAFEKDSIGKEFGELEFKKY